MPGLYDFLQDLRFGLRILQNEPILTLAAVLSIGLGVAANTTVFTMANKVLFQQLPVEQSGSLYAIYGMDKGKPPGETISFPDYLDIRAEKSIFSSVSSYFPLVPANLTGAGGRPNRLWGQIVTGNYFDTARMRPHLGRTFAPSEDQVPDRDFVVVLSHHTWRSKLGGDPSIVGKTIRLNQRPFTVIGIAAPGFRGADTGLIAGFWIPMALHSMVAALKAHSEERFHSREHQWLMTIARLQPGVSIEQAQAALHTIGDRLSKEFPAIHKEQSYYIERAGQANPGFRKPIVAFLSLLLAVMLIVLLIACANVANLLLARAARRQREIGTRLALGAGRGRLIRQLLTESFLLAAMGGAVAILLTRLAQFGFTRIPFSFPVPLDFSTVMDWRVALFALLLTLLTTLFFGLAPALRAGRTDLVTALRVLTSDGSATRKRFRASNLLVVAQVSAALVLLTGAGLVLRSLRNAHTIDLGMNPRNLHLLSVDPALDGMQPAQIARLLPQIQQRLRQIPGVANVSFCDLLPLSFGGQNSGTHNEAEHGKSKRESHSASFVNVGEDFIAAIGMTLTQGSPDLRKQPGGPIPAIVNEELARRLWPGESAVGRIFYTGDTQHRVAGVVRNAKMRTIGESTRPAFFRLLDGRFHGEALLGFRILVRTQDNFPAARLRQEMAAAFPSVSVFDMETMEQHVGGALILPRMGAVIFGFAGGIALLLAITGLFGVIHYSVSRRSREFGIRMALGAGALRILALVLRQGTILVTAGVSIGILASSAGSRLLENILYGVSPTDALTFILVPTVLFTTAALACLVPAWRASRLLPSAALREE